jgi:hypothetical protein
VGFGISFTIPAALKGYIMSAVVTTEVIITSSMFIFLSARPPTIQP